MSRTRRINPKAGVRGPARATRRTQVTP
jgi:hypothetical protein